MYKIRNQGCKKIFSLLLLVVGLIFLYGHLTFSNQNDYHGKGSQSRRFLHSIDPVDSIPLEDNSDKVKFVQMGPEGSKKIQNEDVEDNDDKISRYDAKEQEIEKRVTPLKVKSQDEDFNKQSKGMSQTNVYHGSVAAGWNSGSHRYNSKRRSVYTHDKKGNYVPKERVIHLDLKGAPLLPSAYNVLIPWLAKYGATAILMEYEDMFPWEGELASIAAKNHYTKNEIKNFLNLCKENNLKVIPLVQTFGHLEYALKLGAFSYLREVPELPQALCPSQEDSQILVRSMIDQIMTLHPDINFIHIGCDEVFQMGECSKCRLRPKDKLFLEHVSKTATYVKDTYKITPIIWHDMLSHVSETAMKEYKFGELVEPMVWVYAEDVYRFVQQSVWNKFSRIFPNVWAASAFKGAFGEQSTVPNVLRHLTNNLNWLDVMSSESPKFSGGFRGLVLTGWQRHDHFAVLCELIPSALPSLAITLITASHGYFNSSLYPEIFDSMKCTQTPRYLTNLNLENDPYLWDGFAYCSFPGSLVFKATARLDAVKKDVNSFIERVTSKRAWITDYNRRHNFSSPMRIDQDLEEFPSKLQELNIFIKATKGSLSEWYDIWTTGEWIEQHVWPLLNKLRTIKGETESMKLVKSWPARPLPLLKQLEPFGIKEPDNSQQETKDPLTIQNYSEDKETNN